MPRPPAPGPRQSGRRHAEAALFDLWVRAHAPELYAFAFRLCGDGPTAEDLVQETFYEAWRHAGPLRSIREPRAWLFLVLRRRHARLRRAEQRRTWGITLAHEAAVVAAPDERIDRLESADALQAALDGMSDLFKTPLLLVFAQGMTCAQAAEELHVPLGTVLSRIHRGKRLLREAMRAREEPVAGARRDDDAERPSPRLRIGGAP